MTLANLNVSSNPFRETLQDLLDPADVQLNGDRPWDIHVHNEDFYSRLLSAGSIAAGESYMDGWWSCDRLDEAAARLSRCQFQKSLKHWSWFHILAAKLINLQEQHRAFTVGQRHYDIGNDFYNAMLDPRMIYSCAYWKNATTLEAAQVAKLDLIARKLGLKPGMKVLDIGCGWGGTAKYFAETCGVEVIGITISQQQAELAEESCRGLPVTIRLQDYRDVTDTVDRVVSVGMFEHVGVKNYRTYFDCVRRCLNRDDSLFLLQTIGSNESCDRTDPWIERYIFPNSMLPSAKQITTAAEGVLVIEDWHNFGPDYDKTLMQWYRNFEAHWPQFKADYGDRFYRMWRYYLLTCAGTFRARFNHLWQIVLSPKGMMGGYRAPR